MRFDGWLHSVRGGVTDAFNCSGAAASSFFTRLSSAAKHPTAQTGLRVGSAAVRVAGATLGVAGVIAVVSITTARYMRGKWREEQRREMSRLTSAYASVAKLMCFPLPDADEVTEAEYEREDTVAWRRLRYVVLAARVEFGGHPIVTDDEKKVVGRFVREYMNGKHGSKVKLGLGRIDRWYPEVMLVLSAPSAAYAACVDAEKSEFIVDQWTQLEMAKEDASLLGWAKGQNSLKQALSKKPPRSFKSK